MKSHFLIYIFIICGLMVFNNRILAQWTSQSSGTTQNLRQIRAVDDNIVWICGTNGTVLKTTNGGSSWITKAVTDAGYTNHSIEALSGTIAWVTGSKNSGTVNNLPFKIWKTTNGGDSWQEQYQNIVGFGNGIRFFDSNNGVCFGDPNPFPSEDWEILTTSNGGSNWTRVPKGNYPSADKGNSEYGVTGAIDIVDNTVWVATHSGGNQNRIYKSTNKGLNWTVTSYSPSEGFSSLHYMAFSSINKGVDLSYYGSLSRTNNGGSNWSVISSGIFSIRCVTNIPGADSYIGVGNFGFATFSTDGGATWQTMNTGVYEDLWAVDASTNYAWAAGRNGTIIKVSNTALPVELTLFTAKVNGKNITLKWQTATEVNNYGFEVHRSSKLDKQWKYIGFVNGHGNSNSPKNYSFVDQNVANDSYIYRLKQIDIDGQFEFSPEVRVTVDNLPSRFELYQNYPNPFNPSTTISYEIAQETNVSLKIFDTMGNEISTLVSEIKPPGFYDVTFNASNLSNGVYISKFQAGDFISTKKLILMK